MALKLRDIVARLRILSDKSAAAETEKDVTSTFDRIEAMAKRVGAAVAGIFAVDRIAAFVKASVQAAVDSEAVWNRVGGAVERAGKSWGAMESRVKATAEALRNAAGIGDEEFAAALDRMLAITGDVTLSITQMGLVADVAARFYGGDLVAAADTVGKVLGGNTKVLRELGIRVDDVNQGLEILRQRAQGAAENELNTLEGKLKVLKEAAGDAKKEFGFFALRLAGGEDSTEASADRAVSALDRLAKWFQTHRVSKSLNPFKLFEKIPGIDENQVQQDEFDARQKDLDKTATLSPVIAVAHKPTEKEKAEARARALRLWREKQAMGQVVGEGSDIGFTLGKALSGDVKDAGILGGMKPIEGIADPLALPPNEEIERRQHQVEEFWGGITEVGTHAALGVAGAWQDTFELLLSGNATIGRSFAVLGKGIAGALLGGVAEYAGKKVGENVALSVEELAKGFAAAANPFMAWTAPLHFHAAAEHAGAAALWGVLAGGAGAGQHAIAGGSRGGVSGGLPSGASDIGGRIAEKNVGPQTIIYIDGFNPKNGEHVRILTEGMLSASRSDSRVDVRSKATASR